MRLLYLINLEQIDEIRFTNDEIRYLKIVKRETYVVKKMDICGLYMDVLEQKIRNFRDLDVWRLGKEIVIDVYKITGKYPREELYGLISQMRRSAVSIPSNIAEGFSRFHNQEYKQFLFIALGSCAELETQVEIAYDLEYINEVQRVELLEKIDHETRMIRNLIKKL